MLGTALSRLVILYTNNETTFIFYNYEGETSETSISVWKPQRGAGGTPGS